MYQPPEVQDVLDRFVDDIQDCIEALNRALPHFGKTLENLNVDPKEGKIELSINDLDSQIVH